MIVNIHAAKTQLSKLIELSLAGEEVIIARAGKPVARLTPLTDLPTSAEDREAFPAWMGSLKGQIWIAPDIDAVEAEIAREIEAAVIYPTQRPDR